MRAWSDIVETITIPIYQRLAERGFVAWCVHKSNVDCIEIRLTPRVALHPALEGKSASVLISGLEVLQAGDTFDGLISLAVRAAIDGWWRVMDENQPPHAGCCVEAIQLVG